MSERVSDVDGEVEDEAGGGLAGSLAIPVLLADLRDRQAELIAAWEADEMLSRETWGGMTIANAGAKLIRPKVHHQLYAKGVVYAGDEVVSVPLLKFYNHGQGALNQALMAELRADPEVVVTFAEKLDGTMIQAFERGGEVFLTTRGRLSPTAGEPLVSFVQEARALLAERYPAALDADVVRGKSLIFELILPGNRIVTDYGDDREIVLIAAFEPWRYLSFDALHAFAEAHGLRAARALAPSRPIAEEAEGLAEAHAALEPLAERAPEGFIVSFERDGQVLHRAKVKTPSYYRLRGVLYSFSFNTLATFLDAREDLHDWDAFHAFIARLYAQRLVETLHDDRLDRFRTTHAEVVTFLRHVDELHTRAHDLLADYYAAHPPEDTGPYHRDLALHHKRVAPEVFPYLIRVHRRGELSRDEVLESELKRR